MVRLASLKSFSFPDRSKLFPTETIVHFSFSRVYKNAFLDVPSLAIISANRSFPLFVKMFISTVRSVFPLSTRTFSNRVFEGSLISQILPSEANVVDADSVLPRLSWTDRTVKKEICCLG